LFKEQRQIDELLIHFVLILYYIPSTFIQSELSQELPYHAMISNHYIQQIFRNVPRYWLPPQYQAFGRTFYELY